MLMLSMQKLWFRISFLNFESLFSFFNESGSEFHIIGPDTPKL